MRLIDVIKRRGIRLTLIALALTVPLTGEKPVAAAPAAARASFGQPRMFFYNANNSTAGVGYLDPASAFHNTRNWGPGQFKAGWTQVVPTSQNRIFFYDSGSGAAGVGYLDSGNEFHTTRVWPPGAFAAGWTNIVPTSDGRMFFYNSANGAAGDGYLDASNNFSTVQFYPPGSFANGWTSVIADR